MSCSRSLWAALIALPLLGCPEGPAGFEKVSDDPNLQVRFETARRTLAEIIELKKGRRNVYADCKTMEMLFYKDLRKLRAPAAKKLLDDLERACKDVRPQE